MHDDRVRAGLVALLLVLALAAWSSILERRCEERGGEIVWEVDRAASTAYGVCVEQEP